MKKNFKKLFAILMTVAVVLSMAMPVMAADNNVGDGAGKLTTVTVSDDAPGTGSLTINGGKEFAIYKVFSAEVKPGDNTYTWTIVKDKWGDVTELKDIDAIAEYGAEQMKALAQKLADSPNKPEKETALLSKLPLGYYLLVDEKEEGLTKSQPILVAIPQVVGESWVYDITVTPKSSKTSFEKKIKDAVTGELEDTNTANVGDFVTYYLSADIPTYEDDVYTNEKKTLTFGITDTMSKELTWVEHDSEVAVYVVGDKTGVSNAATINEYTGVKDTDYTVSYPSDGTAGGTFTVDFKKSFLSTYRGKVVVVVFKAKLNNNALIGTEKSATNDNSITGYEDNDGKLDGNESDFNYNGVANPNGATLQYTNSYYGGGTTDTIEDTVTTFSFKLDVKKVDAKDGTLLEGAVFKVYKSKNGAENESEAEIYKNDLYPEGVTLTTAEGTGTAFAEGFAAGTYYLKETEAPAGYRRFDGVITVQIDKDGDAGDYKYTITMGDTPVDGTPKVVEVKDEKGESLPGTGGIGTTIFTFGGLALIVLAGILLVVYTRKQKKA